MLKAINTKTLLAILAALTGRDSRAAERGDRDDEEVSAKHRRLGKSHHCDSRDHLAGARPSRRTYADDQSGDEWQRHDDRIGRDPRAERSLCGAHERRSGGGATPEDGLAGRSPARFL